MNNKDKQAHFLALYEPIHDKFERFCRARVYGALEHKDLINETLLIAFSKIEELKTEKSFLSFLIGISIRVLSNLHRKKKETHIADYLHEKQIDDGIDLEREIDVQLLYKAIAKLPDIQKEAIILFEITGFSIKEIAIMHNASESAVKQRLKRGREKLKELLSSEFNTIKKEVANGK